MTHDSLANERAFIGCLLRSPHELWQVNDIVAPDCISVVPHREIYTAIRDLSERGRQVTITALQSVLPIEFDGFGPTIGILMALKASAEDAGSATDYAPFLAERVARQRMNELARWLQRQIARDDRVSEEIAAEAATKLEAIMATAAPVKPVKLSDASYRVVTFSNAARESDIMPGFSSGLPGLDGMIGRIMGGDLIGIIGALGDGKSGLLAQIGKHIALNAPVLAAHNEMSVEQNAIRALAADSGMSIREIREGAYDFIGADAVRAAQKRIEALHYYLYTDPRMTVRAIRVRALQMKQTIGLGAISIDGLKRLRTDTKHRDKWDRMEEITGELKTMAIELGVPVLIAVQRTRGARRRDDPTPQLDDADAPTLETDSDVVLGIWRDESWLMMNKPNAKASGEEFEKWEHKLKRAKNVAHIIALKVRSGKPFEQKEFRWCGPALKLEDL